MKRLLAAGSGPIFALTKSFRRGEQGRNHNLEFTILEWYHPGFDEHDLMEQVSDLLRCILGANTTQQSYRESFLQATGINPHATNLSELKSFAEKNLHVEWDSDNTDLWLDLLFSHCVQPTLQELNCVYDYPASQAALARIGLNNDGETIARRFEVFYRGVELGNGYFELRDGEEQLRRFTADNQRRQQLGLESVTVDRKLVSALNVGLPDCAGIAIGVDRLLMVKLGIKTIEEVMDFPVTAL